MLDSIDMGPIYSKVPMAGHNELSPDMAHLKGAALHYARYMICCLDVYEREFARLREERPDLKEHHLDHHARMASSLLSDGLMKARSYAGKKISGNPGIFYPDPSRWIQFRPVESIRYEIAEIDREIAKLQGERSALASSLDMLTPIGLTAEGATA